MQQLDEITLIESARHEPEAFAVLYQRYLPRVYRYLYLRLGNQHDSEDIASQVFIETLEGLRRHRYKENGCFPAWLFTIVRRRLVDFQRQRVPISLEEHPSSDPDLLDRIQSDEDLERLSLLLADLDEEKQELLRLRFAAELSFAEIAALENQSEAAVKMTVYRAIDWLRKHWETENG
jgi:RNA polymerase sigma-70 factor (ECF subfamily)